MQRIPDNLEVRTQHNGKRLILSIGVEGESEGNGWREWKPFLDCGGHSEKKQNAAKALLDAIAAKDAEIERLKAACNVMTRNAARYKEIIGPSGAELVERDAAKDAEIAELKRELEKAKGDHHKTKQDAATFRALADEHIQSIESKCAKMRELLGEAADFVVYDQGTGIRDRKEERRVDELRACIDAILESEEA